MGKMQIIFRCFLLFLCNKFPFLGNNVSKVVKQSDRRRRPVVNLAPCSCAAAVMYKSTLPCYAHRKTRPCLTDASAEANKRFVYVDKI